MYIDFLGIANPRFKSINGLGEEHTHKHHQLFYALNSIGSICIDGREYGFQPEHLYYVPAGTVHICKLFTGTHYYIIDFRTTNSSIADGFKSLPNDIVSKTPILVNYLFEQMISQKYSHNPMSKFYQYGYFMTLLTALTDPSFSIPVLIDPIKARNITDRTALNVDFDMLLEHINGMFSVPISIEDMCRFSGYQRSQLFRLFKNRFGTTPHMYVNFLRIKRAKVLLRDMNMRITNIAYVVGFQSPDVFRSVFHKFEGISPSKYRKAIRKDE